MTNRPRTVLVNFRLSVAEHEALTAALATSGARNLSSLVRSLILQAIGHEVDVPGLVGRVETLEQKVQALAEAQEEGMLP